MADYFVHKQKLENQKSAEDAGQVSDSLTVRMALMERVRLGEITLDEAKRELKRIQREGKKAGQMTRAQAYRR